MNPETYTERSRGFVQAAQTLAQRRGHQRLMPEHLLKVLLDDREGLAANLIRAAGADPARGGARRSVAEASEFVMQQLHADADEFDEFGIRLLVVLVGFALIDLDLGHRRQVADDLADLFG